jgi:hypothetical protein
MEAGEQLRMNITKHGASSGVAGKDKHLLNDPETVDQPLGFTSVRSGEEYDLKDETGKSYDGRIRGIVMQVGSPSTRYAESFVKLLDSGQ